MEKGVEIAFQINDDHEGTKTALALADLTGNYFLKDLDLDWRVFRVTLDKQKYFRVLFTGRKTGLLHPQIHKEIREKFDSMSKLPYADLMRMYEKEMKSSQFRKSTVTDVREEYDLWEDKFWQYF
ncbi:MAG: DUF2004 domain-containing protein [Thermoplasmataceae archaeon]